MKEEELGLFGYVRDVKWMLKVAKIEKEDVDPKCRVAMW